MQIGILGGTFDPIHNAHLHAAETALSQAGLDRILFIPAGDPWQKQGRFISDARHRVAMIEAAIADVAGFDIDVREVDRDGPTYTADTLATFPDDDELFLLVGADTALGIRSWHEHESVLARADVLIVPRPGSDTAAAVEASPGSRLLDMAAMDISSTRIRDMARHGQPFRFLVPGVVHDYIMEQNLYTEVESDDMVGETTVEESSS